MGVTSLRKALITGITGQDGSYLAELLLSKGYEVHGIIRRTSHLHPWIYPQVTYHWGDMTDPESLSHAVIKSKPDEVYHLAAQSQVRISFDVPQYTRRVIHWGTRHLFHAIRRWAPRVRVYNAASSEMYGDAPAPQDENTPFNPLSPYAESKEAAFMHAQSNREGEGVFVCNGILFNHESERRGESFVTRKITLAAARIAAGQQKTLALGNLDAYRDWGYAPDYVEAMWLMLQHDKPDDYVVATGESYSIRDFLSLAFGRVGLRWQDYVTEDKSLYRPNEVPHLRGIYRKAYEILGWEPKVRFEELVRRMVDHDMGLVMAQTQGTCQAPSDTGARAPRAGSGPLVRESQ